MSSAIKLLVFLILNKPILSESITLAVASNFALPIKSICETYTGDVQFIFASSGKIYAQILHGAPYDMFFSADTFKPEKLYENNLTQSNKPFIYAVGQIALLSFDKNEFPITLNSLKKASAVALANPRLAPYGRAAKQVLDSKHFQQKRKLIFAENITQTFNFVSSNNISFGFVAISQIQNLSPEQYWIIPNEYYEPVKQAAVVIKSSPKVEKFLRHFNSKKSKDLIRSFGYETE